MNSLNKAGGAFVRAMVIAYTLLQPWLFYVARRLYVLVRDTAYFFGVVVGLLSNPKAEWTRAYFVRQLDEKFPKWRAGSFRED